MNMIGNHGTGKRIRRDSGVSLILVAFGMIFILGMSGLAIDLASLYVGRAQAQRAADAAALAGAKVFVDKACGVGSTPCSNYAGDAQQAAKDIGDRNLIAGVSPNIPLTDAAIHVDTSISNDPRVTVIAGRTTANGNPMPLFFAKIFGLSTANVSATATAEAYHPAGSGPAVAPNCIKPWMYPNCDFNDPSNPPTAYGNKNCQASSGTYYPYIINPNPPYGLAPNAPIGKFIVLKPGDPKYSANSSQFYAVQLPGGGTFSCPSCANNGGGGPGSGSYFAYCIACCYQLPLTAGQTYTTQPITGNMDGPTGSGTSCLINQLNGGSGQDIIDGLYPPLSFAAWPTQLPLFPPSVVAGSNSQLNQQGITLRSVGDSPSEIVVPIYDGHLLSSGSSSNQVTLLGFLKVFVVETDKSNQNSVYGYITDIVSAVDPGSIVATGSPIPVRLIHQ
jgi:Putative Flp pilus-assembly TadE/G-like